MRHNRTQNTRQITRRERHTRLRGLAVLTLLTRHPVVNHLHNRLKRRKLHHRIRDLTSPKRIQTLVETCPAFFTGDGIDAVKGALVGVRHGALHAYFDCFKGTEGQIGEELGRGGRGEVQTCFVLGCGVRAGHVGVGLFEVFVPAVFEGALGGVAEERGGPTGEDAAEAFAAIDFAPGLEVGGVEFGVNLAAGFDEVEGSYGRVSEALGVLA